MVETRLVDVQDEGVDLVDVAVGLPHTQRVEHCLLVAVGVNAHPLTELEIDDVAQAFTDNDCVGCAETRRHPLIKLDTALDHQSFHARLRTDVANVVDVVGDVVGHVGRDLDAFHLVADELDRVKVLAQTPLGQCVSGGAFLREGAALVDEVGFKHDAAGAVQPAVGCGRAEPRVGGLAFFKHFKLHGVAFQPRISHAAMASTR